MNKSFRLNQLAISMSMILGSSFLLSPALANTCAGTAFTGTCGLTQYDMTSPITPKPTAWYFTQKTQDAAIDGTARAQNIYFASGTSSRTSSDIQQLLVDGANLSGHYINVSKEGSATVVLNNKAAVDFIEAGAKSSNTNTHIVVDNSTLNGAAKGGDYDIKNAPNSKYYLDGNAIHLDVADSGDADIDIQNNSLITGRIYVGGAGTHDVTVQDSRIQAGSILLYNATNNNAITVQNSLIDTTNAVSKTANAIEITNLTAADKTHTIVVDHSQLTGSVALSTSGSTSALSVTDSTITKTTQKNGNAISLSNGKAAQLSLDNSEIVGHTVLSGSESVTASLADSSLNGNLIANKAAQIAMDITRSVLTGNVDASAGQGSVDLHLTDSTLSGDINLNGAKVLRSDIWLDNAEVAGNLYGSGAASTLHLANMPEFSGTKFSNFGKLAIADDVVLTDGFTDTNVGSALTVNGTTVTAPVQLSS
ncbi:MULTISPECIES: hypothetical protein [Leclercia]|nr:MULTISPECIES: hypothetical protein [Leclercia]